MRHLKVEELDEKTFMKFKKRFDENYKVRFGSDKITIPENTRVIIDGDVIIFEGKTTEKKKPLYTNQYGTQFFEGDEFYWVTNTLKIVKQKKLEAECHVNDYCLFIGTQPECHRYIYENWDKLKKD